MKLEYGTLSDAELLDIMKKKDKSSEKAFAEIYSRYSQRVYAYCLRIGNDFASAQDLFQETFVKFYENIANINLNNINKLIVYLITIARNLKFNESRKKKNTVLIDEYEEAIADSSASIELNLEQKELEKIIPEALMKLDYASREVIIFRLYEGLRYDEIEKITGVSNNLLRNRFSRAKEKLRLILNKYLDDKKY